jgi:regulator of replication initiation timing
VNNEEKCTRLELENAELREALADKLVKQTLLKRLVAENGEMKLEMEGGACRLMAETFGTMLLESKAANYIETMFELGGVEGHPKAVILVTVQRGEGFSSMLNFR